MWVTWLRYASVLGLLLGVACATAVPSLKPTVFTYNLVGVTGDHHPGERLVVVWKATATAERADAPPPVRLCLALAGPYATVEEAKATPFATGSCPVGGAQVVARSVMTDADPAKSEDVTQELVAPASLAPGYYQFIGVRVSGTGKPTSAASGAGIVRIVSP